MILILRGHIRQSFETRELYRLVKELHELIPLKIYIHTWSTYSSSLSWRTVEEDNQIVTEELIHDYFDDLKNLIVKIIVDDDKDISLIGNTEGNVGISRMPLKGWKNYWYGQAAIIQYIKKESLDMFQPILNTRFDVLTNSVPSTITQIKRFAFENKKNRFTKNTFLKSVMGIDNVMMGNVETIYQLIMLFHEKLDEIITSQPIFIHHEQLVSIMNDRLFKHDLRRMRFH